MSKRRSSPDGSSQASPDSAKSVVDSPAADSAPKRNKKLVVFEAVRLTNVSSTVSCENIHPSLSFQKHQDDAAIRISYKKVVERLKTKQRVENELRRRIEQAEKRQESDDRMMLTVNRYWNQFDDDIRVLLNRFEADADDESGLTAKK